MNYIIVDEDGTPYVTNQPPTADTLQGVGDGLFSLLKLEDNSVLSFNPITEGWDKLPKWRW